MDILDICKTIASSNWFEGLPTAAHKKLASGAKIEKYDKNTFLYHIGDVNKNIFLILSGRIRVSLMSTLGNQFTVDDLGPKDWVGEAGLISNESQIIELQFKEAGQALSISTQLVHEVGKEFPIMYYNILKDHTKRSRGIYQILRATLFYPLKSRLAGRILYLLQSNGVHADGGMYLDLQLSQQDFANFVHGSRQRINKIFKVWSDEGLVIHKSNRYFIPDIEKLKHEVHLVDD